jgi:hypothetical protein
MASIGIFSGKKVYSHDLITAEISDASGHVFFVPIRWMIGDYFLTEINRQVYAFYLDQTRVKTSKTKGAKSFQIIYYDVSHYKPVSTDHITELERIININSLPKKLNKKGLNVLKILGKTEKEDFTVHDITSLKSRLLEHKDRYKQRISELINFMAELQTEEIVTPVKRMVDFVEGDLKTIDAKFMGTVFTQAVKMDESSQKVLNPILTAKKSWVVMILALGMLGSIAGMGYFANEAGAFENIGSGIVPQISSGGAAYSSETLMRNYPNAAALRAGVDSGALDYSKLPNNVQAMVDKTPSPVPIPKENLVPEEVTKAPIIKTEEEIEAEIPLTKHEELKQKAASEPLK